MKSQKWVCEMSMDISTGSSRGIINSFCTKPRFEDEFIDQLEEKIYYDKEILIAPVLKREPLDIVRQLLENPPDEEGGLTAISGFYFQMLVFIEHFVEMINGKWTFLALEFHDDIMAGNEREKSIKFVQVKSSKHSVLSITNSNVHIYNRSTTKKEGTGKGKLRNNSWFDKLIDNAKLVKDCEYALSFELLTDFIICNSEKVNVDLYTVPLPDKIVTEVDHVLKTLKVESVDVNGNTIEYQSRYGKSLSELLSVVSIINKPKIQIYLKYLCTIVSETLGQGVRVSDEDIDWLVGFLISKCAFKGDNSTLFIMEEQVAEIRLALQQRAVTAARPTVYKAHATEMLNKSITLLLKSIRDCEVKPYLIEEIEKYKCELLSNISDDNTLQSLLQRFNDGYKAKFGDSEKDYSQELNSFFKISILLYLIHHKYLVSDKFETLLVKQAITTTFEETRIAFLNLGIDQEYKEGLERLEHIISMASEQEQLEMIQHSSSIYAIFQGDFVNLEKPIVVEINTTNIPKVNGLPNGQSVVNVCPVITVIPDVALKALYPQIRSFQNIEDFKRNVEEQWSFLKMGDEHV
ncbi:hypothetical protein NST50_29655 [Paenibacillus sp. FSL E2-0202]|uniref:hypothetical protein n=1 Tax=Paenibacillus sp. FSL E2-0202 TaxID=2954505 RepID=UPI0030EBDC68